MSIAKKLYLLSLLVVLALATICGVNYQQLHRVNASVSKVVNDTVPSITDLDQITASVFQLRIAVLSYTFIRDENIRSGARKEMDQFYQSAQDALKRYETQDLSDDKDRALFEQVRKNFTEYNNMRLRLLQESDPDKAAAILSQSKGLIIELVKSIEADKAYNRELAREYINGIDATTSMSTVINLIAFLSASAVVLTVSLWLARQISTRLGYAAEVTEHIGAGRLHTDVVVTGRDEISRLMQAVAQMRASLVGVIEEIQRSANSVSLAASEIAAGNGDLSIRTEKQAASLEETASSVEELLSAVQMNSSNARSASELVISGSKVAERSSTEISHAVKTMHDIASSSGRMSEIISVIEGISFQTNILALNAAVEAARAGENGRGFAVVATEVRALAQRSSSAAKEIKDLIVSSVAQIEEGKKIVEGTVDTISEITVASRTTRELMHEIANASGEQSSGIAQINDAIVQIDQTTQQNASLVEQIAATSTRLNEQAMFLQKTISFFETRNNQHHLQVISSYSC